GQAGRLSSPRRDREIEFARQWTYLPLHRGSNIAESGRAGAAECGHIAWQIDQDFQAWRDAEPPAAVGATEYVSAMLAAGIDAVLILQTADRHDDGRIGHIGPIGFDRRIRLRAFRRDRGADHGHGNGKEDGKEGCKERYKASQSNRRCSRDFGWFHRNQRLGLSRSWQNAARAIINPGSTSGVLRSDGLFLKDCTSPAVSCT